jgi:hypothetical protein
MSMKATITSDSTHIFHQNRLKQTIKRLVIELGYLEHCLEKGSQDQNLQTAAIGLDTAIDCLSEHISS